MSNTIDWFEIPVTDMERAVTFYKTIFGFEDLPKMEMGGALMAFFPYEGKHNSGALVKGEGYEPSEKGIKIYFECEALEPILEKVDGAGGTIKQPKQLITEEIGYDAKVLDTEGNIIALHARK